MINYPNVEVEKFCDTYKEYICGIDTLDVNNMTDEQIEELYNYLSHNDEMLCNFFFSFWKNFFDMKTKVYIKHFEKKESAYEK